MRDGYPVNDLPGYFAGRWSVARTISSGTGEQAGSFRGVAEFTADEADLLIYSEHGELELGTHRGPAQRTLHYRLTGPGTADVYFDYGDFFHPLDLRSGWWRASHPCRADHYSGEYLISDTVRWQQHWTVSGPAKDHTITTLYQRVARDGR